jgi:DNA-directed RNA polymerase
MHSEDIIGRLAEEFKTRYAGAMYLAEISSQSVVGKKIREWRVELAKSRGRTVYNGETRKYVPPYEEIALEVKRQKLLASQDPAEIKQGQEMVTPTSIWLEHQDHNAIISSRRAALGDTTIQKANATARVKREAQAAGLDKDKLEDLTESIPHEDVTEQADSLPEETKSADNVKKSASKPSTSPFAHVTAWIPLSFPPPPKKGTWEVSRLRESKYFFS